MFWEVRGDPWLPVLARSPVSFSARAGVGCPLRLFLWGAEKKNRNALNFDSDKMCFLWLLSVCLKRDRFWHSSSGAGYCGSG